MNRSFYSRARLKVCKGADFSHRELIHATTEFIGKRILGHSFVAPLSFYSRASSSFLTAQ
eukprot:765223-Hanusia_phi.AAC.1